MRNDKERLAALRDAVNKMTPGEWEAADMVLESGYTWVEICVVSPDTPVAECRWVNEDKNAAGIVALRNSADWLIGMAEWALKLEAQLKVRSDCPSTWPDILSSEAKAAALEEVVDTITELADRYRGEATKLKEMDHA